MIQRKNPLEILQGAISPYTVYCDGYGNSGSSGNNYLLGIVLAIGNVEKSLYHSGSKVLDEINSFDVAEIDEAYIGQINMSTVSSFCGPQGLIWGYDLCKDPMIDAEENFFKKVGYKGKFVMTYHITPLLEATKSLFGTVDKRRFILRPGAHVPFANKSMKIQGPGRVYSGIALGIPKDREVNACLLMEDYGVIPDELGHLKYEELIREKLAQSVIQVGINQRVEYEEIYVGVKSTYAQHNEIACALIAAPYFTLAQNAIPDNNIDNLFNLSITQWDNTYGT